MYRFFAEYIPACNAINAKPATFRSVGACWWKVRREVLAVIYNVKCRKLTEHLKTCIFEWNDALKMVPLGLYMLKLYRKCGLLLPKKNPPHFYLWKCHSLGRWFPKCAAWIPHNQFPGDLYVHSCNGYFEVWSFVKNNYRTSLTFKLRYLNSVFRAHGTKYFCGSPLNRCACLTINVYKKSIEVD